MQARIRHPLTVCLPRRAGKLARIVYTTTRFPSCPEANRHAQKNLDPHRRRGGHLRGADFAWAPTKSAARPPATRVSKRTLRGGRREGVDVVEVDNGRLRFVAMPTRGMGIWRASCGDVQLGWKSPVKGPVHPAFVPLWEASGIGWLDGFDELLVPLRPGEQRGAGVPAQRRAPLPAARQDRQHPRPTRSR